MISKTADANMHVANVSSHDVEELIVSATAEKGTSPHAMLENVMEVVNEVGAVPVTQRVFTGSDVDTLLDMAGEVDWPLTCLTYHSDSVPASTQICAVKGASVDYIRHDDRPVASLFDRGSARWCRIGGILPLNASASPMEQAKESLELLLSIFEKAGMKLDDLVRTWFFLDEILSWYDDFNQVRNGFFSRHGVFEGLIPASTGIGIANTAGCAVIAEALLVSDESAPESPRAVHSPVQCAATEYGSSFSRAVEVVEKGHRRIYISGTASINNDGQTIRKEDFAGQMEVTLAAVREILRSNGMDWQDTVRGIAYAPRPQDMTTLHRKLKPLGLPVAVVPAVVCRDDLLFELELDAIQDMSAESREKDQDVQNEVVSKARGE